MLTRPTVTEPNNTEIRTWGFYPLGYGALNEYK